MKTRPVPTLFASAMAAVFSWFSAMREFFTPTFRPRLRPRLRPRRRIPEDGFAADRAALRSDWEKVIGPF